MHEKMAKKLIMYQKKLHELESQLRDGCGLQLDTAASDPRRSRMSSEDLRNRFRFLSRLLAAEVASQPQNPQLLHVLRERLAAQFDAFFESRSTRALKSHDDVRSDSTQELLCGDVREPGSPISEAEISKPPGNFVEKEEEFSPKRQISVQLHRTGQRVTGHEADFYYSGTGALQNHDDTLSICSDCTQALRYDDVRGSASPISDAEDVSGENLPEKFYNSIGRDADVKRKEAAAAEETIWSIMGKYFVVFGCGITVGAICMVLFCSSPDQFIHYEAFLLPPT